MHCVIEQQNILVPTNGNTCRCGAEAVVNTLCINHFCEQIEQRVQETITRFSMLSTDDKIAVAYSGGKDSTVLLYILHKLGYKVEAITLNAYIGCYSKENVQNATAFSKQLGVHLSHISFREEFGYSLCYLRTLIKQGGNDLTSCTICGVLRRYLLNKHARNLDSTKIAFGHNLDDEAQSILMNLLKGNPEQLARIGPITGITKQEKFVQRVKPLYFVTEQEVITYSKIKQFPVHYGACPCSVDSFRYFIKTLLKNYEDKFPQAKQNIVELFLKLKPLLMKGNTEKLTACGKCGEPSSHGLCRACALIEMVVK